MKTYDIVLIFNGLGNQMSQYAFYLAKKSIKKEVYLLNLADYYCFPHNGFELDNVFGININKMPDFLYWICRKRFSQSKFSPIRKIIKLFSCVINDRVDYSFDASCFLPNHKVLNYYIGGWHSEQYHLNIGPTIRSVYQFDISKIQNDNKVMLGRIQKETSVSIHVRRGDYVGSVYESICSKVYYEKAITFLRKASSCRLVYFVFTDDLEYAKSLFTGDDYIFICGNNGSDSWIDMCLMSYCKHNIIANSTFSWWGAWLNRNPEKIIVRPDRFYSLSDTPDFFPKSWVTVE